VRFFSELAPRTTLTDLTSRGNSIGEDGAERSRDRIGQRLHIPSANPCYKRSLSLSVRKVSTTRQSVAQSPSLRNEISDRPEKSRARRPSQGHNFFKRHFAIPLDSTTMHHPILFIATIVGLLPSAVHGLALCTAKCNDSVKPNDKFIDNKQLGPPISTYVLLLKD
jgi:hypothetical protein